jgi:type I restriction enzyme S subunit
MIGSIGAIYKVDEESIGFAIKNVALYKSSQNEEYQNYIYMYLKSYDMQRYMGNVISGSIQKFIGLGALRNMPILLDEETIRKYEKKTQHIFSKLTLIKLENQKLTKLRDWLLPMLMNGQVTVKN